MTATAAVSASAPVPALRTHRLAKHFGGIAATQDVSISIAHGARHALIGPNGAGKTTLVNLLTGVLAPTAGQIYLGDEDITRLALHQRVRRGLVRTFQISQLFDQLTPLESITLAIAQREGAGRRAFRPLGRHDTYVEEAAGLLAQLHLADVMNVRAAVLAYGRRRLLEIAIALAARPRVLLLDEPVAGIPAGESREVLDTLAALPADMTLLLIEHDMDLVFRFATSMSVLVNGALLAEGAPEDMARDPRVKAAYLGEAVGA